MTPRPNDLDLARRRIECVDRELIQLLRRRMDAVQAVAAHKQDSDDSALFDPERERHVAGAWQAEADRHGLSAYHTGRILREVLNYSRRSQEPLLCEHDQLASCRVGYQGIEGCYGEIAIGKLFAHRAETSVRAIGMPSFAEVFDALAAGHIDRALVPIENSLVGGIGEVNHRLATDDVAIVDEEILDVRHCLAGLPGSNQADLREVRSHPVALQQCRRLLARLGPTAAVEHFDTAGAARHVRDTADARIACICSAEAAERHGLHVLATDVGDHAHNQTRFVLLAREAESPSRKVPTKTSIRFSADDGCGALAHCLASFADHGVNLVRLESRPQPSTPWEYLFVADFLGHRDDEHVAAALEDLRSRANTVHVLGTYPSRTAERAAVPARRRPRPIPAAARPADAPDEPSFHVRGVPIGGRQFTLVLGPCAVESRRQVQDAAAMVKEHGAHLMRGGAFKPRSSPHSFQGLGLAGLELLAEAGRDYELPVVTEVLRGEDVEAIAAKADVLQVGARNMQNFELLKQLGRTRRPVLLKRGLSATLKELLLAADYIKAGGNQRVILCERGIRTFETATRNTLDISAVPVLKSMTDLPVLVDPSHAAGVRHLVVPLALAAAAAGADGLIVECHPRPEEALCDKDQALRSEDVERLVAGLRPILDSQGRTL
jgi:chorismate mutase/prephenate dehydratase